MMPYLFQFSWPLSAYMPSDFSILLLACLMCSWNQSAPLGLLKRFLFVLSLLSSTILGTCPTKLVSPCRKPLVYAYRCHQDVLLVQNGAILFVDMKKCWLWLIARFISAFTWCILVQCCVKSRWRGCCTNQLRQRSGNNVAAIWIDFKLLQHVAATKCCVKIIWRAMLHDVDF